MTPKQLEVLDFIQAYQAKHRGVSPTLAEMASGLGYSTKTRASVSGLLDGLEREGRIRRERRRARAITIIPHNPLAGFTTAQLQAEIDARAAASAPMVAACGDCGERAASPTLIECNRTVCPMRVREAA